MPTPGLARLVAALIAVLLLSGAPAPVLAQATPTPAERTQERHFLPLGPGGLGPGLALPTEDRGECVGSSLAAVDRPDAWACVGADSAEIYDPCFLNPTATAEEPGALACFASPFATEGVAFTPTGSLEVSKGVASADQTDPDGMDGKGSETVPVAEPAAPDDPTLAVHPDDIPWALELANGERCTLLTGATMVLAGERVNYGCEGGGSVLGEVDRGALLWVVDFLPDDAVATDQVAVLVAWS